MASTIIIPSITDAGRDAAINDQENGFAFAITHVSIGTTGFAMDGSQNALTALPGEVGKTPVAGGGRIPGTVSVTVMAIMRDTDIFSPGGMPYNVKCIGLWSGSTLFAVYSTGVAGSTIFQKVANLDLALSIGLSLRPLDAATAGNITVTVDESVSAMSAMLGQHTASLNPHPQYTPWTRARNAGIDAMLAETNSKAGVDLNTVIVPGQHYFTNTSGNRPFDYGLLTVKNENANIIYQQAEQASTGRYASRYSSNTGATWSGWAYYATVAELNAAYDTLSDSIDMAIDYLEGLIGTAVSGGYNDTVAVNTSSFTDGYTILPEGTRSLFIFMATPGGGGGGGGYPTGGHGGGGGAGNNMSMTVFGNLSGWAIVYYLPGVNAGKLGGDEGDTNFHATTDNPDGQFYLVEPGGATILHVVIGSGWTGSNGMSVVGGDDASWGGDGGPGGEVTIVAQQQHPLFIVRFANIVGRNDGGNGGFNGGGTVGPGAIAPITATSGFSPPAYMSYGGNGGNTNAGDATARKGDNGGPGYLLVKYGKHPL